MFTRQEIEEIEIKTLASYAMKAKHTKGRVHKEEEHPYRTCYQRDRDRIIHSTAFRRLEYKTQVFVNHEGDYYRTRLTHTLEVAQIAVSIARVLGLNGDLAEAVALAHDIGHPPFGHSGEEELRALMKDHGGFDHNLQGLRVVDLLEERYPDFRGLNLSWEVREGINKHSTPYDRASNLIELEPDKSPTLEAQAVDLSLGKGLFGVQGRFVLTNDHVQFPLQRQFVPVLDHFRDFVTRVDVHQRKRHMPEKGLAGKPQQHRAVLADGPEHGQVFEFPVRFAEDVNALGFQVI